MNEPSLACPAYVREACQLILGAWVISVSASMLVFYQAAASGETDPVGMALLILTVSAVMGLPRFWLVFKLKAKVRWARTATLVVLASGWVMLARSLWRAQLSGMIPLSLIADSFAVALEAFACTLLFSAEASAWFHQKARTPH
jgi:hypothetical protein